MPSFTDDLPQTDINFSELPLPKISPFEELCKIQAETKIMLQQFLGIIDKVLVSDKQLVEEEIQEIVDKMKNRQGMIMEMIELLPHYQGNSLENYQKDVLRRHQESQGKFREALSKAMDWKKEIHTVINYQLENNF